MGPPQHPVTGLYQQPHMPHGRPPSAPPQDTNQTAHTPHGYHQQQQQQQQMMASEGTMQLGPTARPGSAAPVVKVEDQALLPRLQVYAQDVPFHTIAGLQPVSS